VSKPLQRKCASTSKAAVLLRKVLIAGTAFLIVPGVLLVPGIFSVNSAVAQEKPPDSTKAASPAESLSANACLQQLADKDEVVVTAAFHDGIGGFKQLEELIARNPWGNVEESIQTQLDKLVDELSPFLIVKVNKKQALMLDSHRDLIKWILVQSTDKACG
jgi:hypothetical protein